MTNSLSDALKALIRGDISEDQYFNKIKSHDVGNDLDYLNNSGDIKLVSDNFTSRVYEILHMDILSQKLKDVSTTREPEKFQKISQEIIDRYKEAVSVVEGFFDDLDTPREKVEGSEKILNNDGDVSFKWWEVDGEFAFRRKKSTAVVAAIKGQIQAAGSKVTRKICTKHGKAPPYYMNEGVDYNVNIDKPSGITDKYGYRRRNTDSSILDHLESDGMKKLGQEDRDILLAIMTPRHKYVHKLPESIIRDYYDNFPNKVIEKSRDKSKVEEHVKGSGVDDIEEKTTEYAYERLDDMLGDRKRLKSRHVRYSSSSYHYQEIRKNMRSLPDDKLEEIWTKEYDHSKDGEDVERDIHDICTSTAMVKIAWGAECLSSLPNDNKAKILKEKIKKEYSRRGNSTVRWPSFDIDESVLDELTSLQLAKFINMCGSEGFKDVSNLSFYKSKMKKKIFKGDDRAKEAMSTLKDIFGVNKNTASKSSSNSNGTSNNSSSKTKKSKHGIMKEKAKKACQQISSWVSDFTSYGEMINYLDEHDEEFRDTKTFEELWESVDYSSFSSELEYSERANNKKNLKLVRDLSERDFHDFTIPEVDDE